MILFATPILAFIIIMVIKTVVRYAVRPLSKCTCSKFVIRKFVTLKIATILHEEEQRFINGTLAAAQPLIQPTSIVPSYGTCIND